MSDIWVRFNAWENFDPSDQNMAQFTGPHTSVWYPVIEEIPEILMAVNDVLYHMGDVELGGVLITKIPPGGSIARHVDGGWHAAYYPDKYGLQLKGGPRQSFNFDGVSVSPKAGQVFWFDNSQPHWVKNDSREDRMTMIICTRKAQCRGE